MGSSSGKIDLEEITQEQVELFYNWLQGTDCPKDLYPKHKLHLTKGQAFSVIYYLQEVLGVLPDRYEQCKVCGDIYDSDSEGCHIGEDDTYEDEGGKEKHYKKNQYGHYCDWCRID